MTAGRRHYSGYKPQTTYTLVAKSDDKKQINVKFLIIGKRSGIIFISDSIQIAMGLTEDSLQKFFYIEIWTRLKKLTKDDKAPRNQQYWEAITILKLMGK